jgi:GT2 family glycosyltransferase
VKLSIVIPTYNRGPKLADTIQAILRSDMTGIEAAEVIVVDDGSKLAAEESVGKISCPPGFSLRFIHQANAGPGPARNTGFRAATGDLVMFIDDDILVPLGMVQQYLRANLKFPGAVVFGRSPFKEGSDNKGLRKFLSDVQLDPTEGAEEESYVEIPVVGSGHIAFSPKLFREENRVYRDDLRSGSEEIDLTLRLRQRGTPYYFAPHIVADHWQPVDLRTICLQQFKHSIGVAEAYLLCPGALQIPVVAEQLRAHGPVSESNTFSSRTKKHIKTLFAAAPIRRGVLNVCAVAQHAAPAAVQSIIYRACLSLHFFAGFREGLRRYSGAARTAASTH